MSLVRYRPKPSDRIPATRSDDSAGSATGHRAGPNDTDWESEALIAQLRLEDLEDQARYLPRRHDGGPTDEHLACITQQEELKEWIRYIEDMRYATDLQSLTPLPMANVTPAVVQEDTTAAMLNELAITERAAEDDRRAAQCLQDGQPLPPMTDNQKWVERRAAERESSPKSAPLPSLNPMRCVVFRGWAHYYSLIQPSNQGSRLDIDQRQRKGKGISQSRFMASRRRHRLVRH